MWVKVISTYQAIEELGSVFGHIQCHKRLREGYSHSHLSTSSVHSVLKNFLNNFFLNRVIFRKCKNIENRITLTIGNHKGSNDQKVVNSFWIWWFFFPYFISDSGNNFQESFNFYCYNHFEDKRDSPRIGNRRLSTIKSFIWVCGKTSLETLKTLKL